jgi:hypothetical protein
MMATLPYPAHEVAEIVAPGARAVHHEGDVLVWGHSSERP